MPISVQGVTAHIAVFDMPTSIAFYRDVLGFTVDNRAGEGDDVGWCFLRMGNAELMLNTAYDRGERPAAPDPQRVAAHEDATFYFDCKDVDAAYVHLKAKGLDVEPPKVSWYGMQQLYVKDPDGYLLCFQRPAKQ